MSVKMRTTCTWTERPYEALLFPGIGFGPFLRSLSGGRRRPPCGGARAIKVLSNPTSAPIPNFLEPIAAASSKTGINCSIRAPKARRKAEVLEGEIEQLKSDCVEKNSDFKKLFSAIHEKIDEKFAIMEKMVRKILEFQTKTASPEARGATSDKGVEETLSSSKPKRRCQSATADFA
ncbi:hypothetical protein M5K25_001338 [Dendrobium thyrsiflorum]|uniref:Uncharacterized protein n=1 Tax=Dendrobium thyrsiflorum TaxID=117978 RepID=A0ABD0VQ38_DENTH